MYKNKSSVILNLSNQANACKAYKSSLSQFNFFVIIGMGYLNSYSNVLNKPISVFINKVGELTVNGLDEELINDENIRIYSDRKVTNSE